MYKNQECIVKFIQLNVSKVITFYKSRFQYDFMSFFNSREQTLKLRQAPYIVLHLLLC